MPAPKTTQAEAEKLYPNLETFIESAGRAAIPTLFAGTRAKLDDISKGPKGPAAKKALAGIDKAEALLTELFGVREKLEEQARAKKGRR